MKIKSAHRTSLPAQRAGVWLLCGCLFWFICQAGLASTPSHELRQSAGRRFKLPKRIVNPLAPAVPDPAEVAVGERLFLEHRFSQFFFASSGGDANATISQGDPVVATTLTATGSVAGSFSGLAMSCRACHLVSEQAQAGLGNRTYADFAARSPIPKRGDGKLFTLRNTPAMVNASIPREANLFLHFDGEFPTGEALVRGTFTGRNFGWLREEKNDAIKHIAHVIRHDNGHGDLAREFGGSYARILKGTDRAIPELLRLPPAYRIDVAQASDPRILDAVARLVTAYMDSLSFARDEHGEYEGSPYDAFLETNRFERMPADGQADLYYSRHLLSTMNAEPSLKFITPAANTFQLLDQEFRFGPEELAGLRIFFALAGPEGRSTPWRTSGVGNCVACHAAPHFTDFRFHNTGVAQEEYDSIHGDGRFAALHIPGFGERNTRPDFWLPAGTDHPHATGPFQQIPEAGQAGFTDLGLWNVFANAACALPQPALRGLFAEPRRASSDEDLLPHTIALFKTPGVRGLALSGPYFHTGRKERLENVIAFYREFSALAREGKVRNAAPELLNIRLGPEDVKPLAAFLRSLNEDYE